MVLRSDRMQIHIGYLTINNPVLVAPMAGISDFPFRQILRKMGSELLFTEMVSSKGLIYNNERTQDLLTFSNKGLIAVQLFGEDVETMVRAAKILQEEYSPDLIDINMGCPAPKIVKNGSGAALMKNTKLAGEIISAVVNTVEIPVTVKMRKGWKDDNINAVELAKIAEENGAVAVTIHGRTRSQFYSGDADWQVIKDVKDNTNITVIGNGDVFSPEDAKKMMKETGCDGVMLARGIRGNPWLVKRVNYYLEKNILLPEADAEDKIIMAIDHLKTSIDYYGEEIAIPRMRKHISWYLKGMSGSTHIKDKLNRFKEKDEIIKMLMDYLKQF